MQDMDFSIDADHRLLLQSCLPLLNSRNDAVVLAVATLYFYLAPPVECRVISKPLIRLLRSHRETQAIILDNIVTISAIRPVCWLSCTCIITRRCSHRTSKIFMFVKKTQSTLGS